MATIISIANMKGGVGKTTLTVSLAEGLCYLSKQVLVFDLDGVNRESWRQGESLRRRILAGSKLASPAKRKDTP